MINLRSYCRIQVGETQPVSCQDSNGPFESKWSRCAGVVSFLYYPASVDEMIHQADTLIYKVKASSKNDILFHESEEKDMGE